VRLAAAELTQDKRSIPDFAASIAGKATSARASASAYAAMRRNSPHLDDAHAAPRPCDLGDAAAADVRHNLNARRSRPRAATLTQMRDGVVITTASGKNRAEKIATQIALPRER
jgi:hypothetical protein